MVSARIPELKDCGGGVPLALGAKIISVVFFAISSITAIGALGYIIRAELDFRNPDPDSHHHDERYVEVIAVMVMIVGGVLGTLASLLWYGVKEHKPSFVLPWAILTAAFAFVFTFFAFVALLHTFSYVQVFFWIVVVILYYCVLVVYSHFRELMREQNLPQSLNDSEVA